jgi:putative endonuclease
MNSVIYTGVTSDPQRRVWEHREKFVDGFTKRYNVWKLVYYEVGEDVISATEREKQITSWRGRERLRSSSRQIRRGGICIFEL